MSSGNTIGRSPEEMRSKVNELRERVRMMSANGASEGMVSLVIECIAVAQELAKVQLRWDPQQAHMKYFFIDIVLDLAPVVDARLPLRKELIDQGFKWIDHGENLNYKDLKNGSYLYHWLRRADSTVVKSNYMRLYGTGASKPPYSDEELNAFYNENVELVHWTMMHKVHPDSEVFYEDPLSQHNAATYVEFYEKLLAISHGELEFPKSDSPQMK